MGYFHNGFVFTSQPDFEAASKAVPGRCSRGYKHNQRSIWLLDFWKPKGKPQLRRAPFCDSVADGFLTDVSLFDAATGDFLTNLRRLQQATDFRSELVSQVHLTLAVAGAVGLPTFFFAADDNETDMACNAVSGSLVSFSCRLDRLSVRYSRSQAVVTPLNYADDEEGLQESIAAAKSIVGFSVSAPREIDDGQVLYENPVIEWPKTAGNPAEILGLGTWDPFVNVETDFAVEFENLKP